MYSGKLHKNYLALFSDAQQACRGRKKVRGVISTGEKRDQSKDEQNFDEYDI